MDLGKPTESNYYTTCPKLTNDTGTGRSEDCITDNNKVTLTIVQKKRDCVIQLEPSSCFESDDTKHRQTGKSTQVSSIIDKKVGREASLELVNSCH